MNRYLTILLALCITSCSVKTKIPKYSFDPNANSIVCTDNTDTLIHFETLFIPSVLKRLRTPLDDRIKYRHFSSNTPNKYCPVHISGCRDTLWAADLMTDHIMKKYHVSRYDSTILDTVYWATVLDESKLTYSEPDCQELISLGRRSGDHVLNTFNCINWKSYKELLIPLDMNSATSTVEAIDREGVYDLTAPVGMARALGFETYRQYLIENLGIDLEMTRVDTLNIGIYRYKDQ